MNNPLRCLLATVVTGFVWMPASHSRADTIYVACALDGTIRQYTTNGVGTVFARASLAGPEGVAFDQAGNLYVANESFNTIARFNTNGVASIFAADPGNNSILSVPAGLAFDEAGNLYVANNGNNTIEKFDTNGVPSLFATDDGSETILDGPEGLAFDSAGNLYAANDGNFIEKFSTNGTNLGEFGDSSFLSSPVGLAFDTASNLYVANSQSAGFSPTIAMFDTAGDGSVFASAMLDFPEFLAFDTNGNLYVSNSGQSNNVEKFDIHGTGSVLTASGLDYPFGIAFDSAEHLYVANTGNFIQEFDTNGVNLLRFADTSISNPQGMGFDSTGNLYVANYSFGSVEKFDTNGAASFFAFPGVPYGLAVDGANNVYVANNYFLQIHQIMKYTPNGSGSIFATNYLSQPQFMAFDSLGNLYVLNGFGEFANSFGNTITKFDSNGNGAIFANGSNIYSLGPGLAIDNANNVYAVTNYIGVVKYSTAGILSPFATDPGQSYNPQGMAFDSVSNLYVANYYDGTVVKFDNNGNRSVFASGLMAPTSVVINRSATALFVPTLAILQSGSHAVLSWPLAAASYNLQSATNLASPNWLPVPGTVVTNGANLVLTNPLAGSVRFFRLATP